MRIHDQQLLTVVAVDNQEIVLAGLGSLPLSNPDLVETVRTYTAVADVDVTGPAPDVVILDFWLGRDDTESIDAVGAFKQWGAQVLLYTSEESPHKLRSALRAGVDALCLKNDGMPALICALRALADGQPATSTTLARAVDTDIAVRARLTTTEIKVLTGFAYGLSTAQVAERLVVSEETVKTHQRSIHRKYREATGEESMSRSRVLFEALRDGYWDARRLPEVQR